MIELWKFYALAAINGLLLLLVFAISWWIATRRERNRCWYAAWVLLCRDMRVAKPVLDAIEGGKTFEQLREEHEKS